MAHRHSRGTLTQHDKFSYSIKGQPQLGLQGRYLNRIWSQEEAVEACMKQIRAQLEKRVSSA